MLSKEYLELSKRIEKIYRTPAYEQLMKHNKKILSLSSQIAPLNPLIETIKEIMQKMEPTSPFKKAIELNYSRYSDISSSLSSIVKERYTSVDVIKKTAFSNLIVPDSLSSKLNDLLDSVEEDIPAIREEVLQSADTIANTEPQAKKLTFGQLAMILSLILPIIAMLQTQYNEYQSGIQEEQHHQNIIDQNEQHHQEMIKLRLKESETIGRKIEKQSELFQSLIDAVRSNLLEDGYDSTEHVSEK